MKERKSRRRWNGKTTVTLKTVTPTELAQRGHKKVPTIDDKTGYRKMVTLPRAPWEKEKHA